MAIIKPNIFIVIIAIFSFYISIQQSGTWWGNGTPWNTGNYCPDDADPMIPWPNGY